MSRPGILIGGNTSLLRSSSPTTITPTSSTGVFATHPGATPKYSLNRGPRDAEYRDTMARLFIDLPPGDDALQSFLASLPPESRALGKVLATGGGTGGSAGTGFIDFLLTQASEDMREKAQIVDTLTDNYVAFYTGQEPPLFQYGGTVLNTYQDDQRVWMLRLYRDILRGTRLANRGLIARMRYDSFIVSGYLENLVLGLSGDAVDYGSFQFSMRVKQLSIFTPTIGLPTLVETPASSFRLNATQSTVGDINRAGALMSATPPTAQSGPAADSLVFSVVNPVQEANLGVVEAERRLQIAIDAEREFNEGSNASNDGAGGVTNIYNPTQDILDGVDPEDPTSTSNVVQRVGNRLRGILGIAPEGATLTSNSG